MIQEVILVNEQDEAIGTMEKLAVHLHPQLHRAFSVFIFNTKGEMLLQQRAFHKYHSGGLWTNACCGHPSPELDNTAAAALKRLGEEMGMQCPLTYGFHFIYKAAVGNGLIEHELDHVFFATTDQMPQPNKDEVAAYQYMSINKLQQDVAENSALYTEWFKIILDKVLNFFENNQTQFATISS